ncbi:hypothetical protein N7510_002819 [Penicillium lagena]|uniref:uncharacterized protein n=1 Tax=Penicillium lagena TaxID=94218 RepID=UPI00254191FA|nr:uncharacterized protein N7510_002819 [Penicillium lagena]KAJ5618835.1 hypothetical protein N7510_002819 [Penicillium lagena]
MAYPAERSHLLQHTSRLERQVAELQARLKASESSSSHDPVTSHHGELSSDVVLLSLNAAAEPSFVGATSGLSLSRLVEGILAESRPTDHPAPEDAAWGAGTAAGPLVDAEEMLLDTFFNRVHPRYPFLAQRSFQQPEDDQDASYLFQRDMVCAIGARLVQLHPELYRSASPEVYFSRAMLQVDKALAQQSLQRVQALLLIATYLLRTPTNLSSIGSWHLIGLAVRHAVELGLHRNLRGARARQLSAEDMEIRHRVFWSAYLLDRAVSLTLGRPFALADHDIDVPVRLLPFSV